MLQSSLRRLVENRSTPRWHSWGRAPPSVSGLGVPRPRTGFCFFSRAMRTSEWVIGRRARHTGRRLRRSYIARATFLQGGADVRSKGALHSLVATLSLVALSTAPACAQVAPTPTPGTASGSGGEGGAIALLLIIVAAFIIVGVGVKLYDLRRKRESEAVQLQAQVSDALMREQLLAGVPIMATARTSLWRRSAATIEIAGQVPSLEVRDTALRIARGEAGRIRPDVEIEDRLAVVPRHAA